MFPSPPRLAASTLALSEPKHAISFIASLSLHAVALDVTRAGIRPRELSRSDRRDLGAAIRRQGLSLSGLDLMIPPQHFEDPEHQSRACEAVVEAFGMARELSEIIGQGSRAMVSVMLPSGGVDPARELAYAADLHGAQLVDHTPGSDLVELVGQSSLIRGVDPASSLLASRSPAKDAALAAAHRLSDAGAGQRVIVGSEAGELDLLAYIGACSVGSMGDGSDADNQQRWVTIDARGIHDPGVGIQRAISAWEAAMPPIGP